MKENKRELKLRNKKIGFHLAEGVVANSINGIVTPFYYY